VHFGIERPFEELKLSTVTSEELLEAIAVNLQVTTEYRIRLAEAAQDEGVSVEEFVLSAVERALRPVESRRAEAARDILELEALWRAAHPAAGREEEAPPA